MSQLAKHYYQTVGRQIMDRRFDYQNGLRLAGIKYQDLPIILKQYSDSEPIDVITFVHADTIKYAVIKHVWTFDKDFFHCYTTFSYPKDGDWLKLVEDVDAQLDYGAEPMIMPSKVRVILNRVMFYPTQITMFNMFDPTTSGINPTTCKQLRDLGYTPQDLFKMDHWDVDEAWLRELDRLDKEIEKEKQCERKRAIKI